MQHFLPLFVVESLCVAAPEEGQVAEILGFLDGLASENTVFFAYGVNQRTGVNFPPVAQVRTAIYPRTETQIYNTFITLRGVRVRG